MVFTCFEYLEHFLRWSKKNFNESVILLLSNRAKPYGEIFDLKCKMLIKLFQTKWNIPIKWCTLRNAQVLLFINGLPLLPKFPLWEKKLIYLHAPLTFSWNFLFSLLTISTVRKRNCTKKSISLKILDHDFLWFLLLSFFIFPFFYFFFLFPSFFYFIYLCIFFLMFFFFMFSVLRRNAKNSNFFWKISNTFCYFTLEVF